ncbi:MAG: sterol desaturase family protein [Pseudomonadota bacterium]
MFEVAAQWFTDDWAVNFSSPQKRLFWGHLFAAFFIAFIWLVWAKRQRTRSALKHIFSREAWASKSARADYLMFTINSIVMGAMPRLVGSSAVAYLLFETMHAVFDGRPLITLIPPWVVATLFTLVLFVVDDFARYAVHRLMHAVPVLWAFHKVHHSATSLNPVTVLRTHPVEGIIFSIRGALVQGACIGVFVFCFGDKVSLVMILGANAIKFGFNAIGSNLRHSHIAIGFWKPLEKVVMSPAQHQIHHSVDRAHYDKNFGVALSCWDLMFDSLVHSTANQSLKFGLRNNERNPHSLKQLYFRPFLEAGALLVKPITRLLKDTRSKPLPQALNKS